MPAVNTSGSQAATINTEHTLATITAAGTYVLTVDTAVMLAGDTLELRVYLKTLAGSTSRVAYYTKYIGAQSTDDVVKVSVPVPTTHEVKFTLKQTVGTGRTYDWEIMTI